LSQVTAKLLPPYPLPWPLSWYQTSHTAAITWHAFNENETISCKSYGPSRTRYLFHTFLRSTLQYILFVLNKCSVRDYLIFIIKYCCVNALSVVNSSVCLIVHWCSEIENRLWAERPRNQGSSPCSSKIFISSPKHPGWIIYLSLCNDSGCINFILKTKQQQCVYFLFPKQVLCTYMFIIYWTSVVQWTLYCNMEIYKMLPNNVTVSKCPIHWLLSWKKTLKCLYSSTDSPNRLGPTVQRQENMKKWQNLHFSIFIMQGFNNTSYHSNSVGLQQNVCTKAN
jgi:hypothetical protein